MDPAKAYEQLGRWVMREFSAAGFSWGSDIDGMDIQDKADELGILVQVEYDSKLHGGTEGEFDEGDEIFIFAPGCEP